MSDTFQIDSSGARPLEELVEEQAIAVPLKLAVMACMTGEESRRWTIFELVDRLRNLGIKCSKASITGVLAELEVELALCSWAPWQLVERGQEWILAPKSALLEVLSGTKKLPVKEPLSQEHKAVLLVVIGHRRKGGVSKTRVGEILGLDAASYLADLSRQKLVYADPSRDLNFWRPTQEALLALGFRSFADIPELVELEKWFESQKENKAASSALDSFFRKTEKLKARRLNRERLRRSSVNFPAQVDLPAAFVEPE